MAPVPKNGSGCIILSRQFAKLFALVAAPRVAAPGDVVQYATLKDPDTADDFGFRVVSSSPVWRVSFQFAGGPNYVSCTLGGVLEPSSLDSNTPDDAATWELIKINNDHEFFKIRNVSYGLYLTATNDFQVACCSSDGSHSQEWKVISHNILYFNPDELQDLGSSEQAKLQNENDAAGIGQEADDAREDAAAAANNSNYSEGGYSGGGYSGDSYSGGGYSGGGYSGGGYSGPNICGNPTCGADHICAADYNRIVQPMGYPGVPQ